MKTYKDFLGIEVEKNSLFKAPACLKHDGMRWDYIIQSGSKQDKELIDNLDYSKVSKVKYIKSSGVWLIKCIRH